MSEKTIHILLVEHSEAYSAIIREALKSVSNPVKLKVAGSLAEARAALAGSLPDLAVINLYLPDGTGMDLLPQEEGALFPAVILAENGNKQTAVEAMKAGAIDYVVLSPETLADMTGIVERALGEGKRGADKKLVRSENRYRTLFESAGDAIFLLDLDTFRFVDCNQKTQEIFACRREDLINKTPYDLSSPLQPDGRESKEKAQEVIRATLEEGLQSFEWKHTRCDGTPFDAEVTLTPIIGYADYLRERCSDRLDETELNCLSDISSSGQKMLALMEDLLCLAKVGQVERPAEPVEAKEVAEEVISDLTKELARAGVTVELGDLPSLRVPRTLMIQVFGNLIGNAMRYGCEAGGVIEVGGIREGACVRLYIRDHGHGIPAEERARIFEAFYRGTTGKGKRGTGIGLATVMKIARLFEGRAWAEETSGGGSTF